MAGIPVWWYSSIATNGKETSVHNFIVFQRDPGRDTPTRSKVGPPAPHGRSVMHTCHHHRSSRAALSSPVFYFPFPLFSFIYSTDWSLAQRGEGRRPTAFSRASSFSIRVLYLSWPPTSFPPEKWIAPRVLPVAFGPWRRSFNNDNNGV